GLLCKRNLSPIPSPTLPLKGSETVMSAIWHVTHYKPHRAIMLATMTSKGQITIPKLARNALHLTAGDRIEFISGEDGRLFLLTVTNSVRNFKGILPKPARTVEWNNANYRIGLAKGEFEVPENIDAHNNEVAHLFCGGR
ncbi:MAG: AbrB/MazE/SpoVT family DNA-binding domain-containing protein, partial [Rhodocyclaceae bacterium]|nr:AbrB/MazE/SpoVT family DNA-binding domain-containing protein [Rhodocyclaceae bacterium]